jgi:hypothetical protein
MKVVYVDTIGRYLSTDSRHWIYSSIIGLAALDVLSTYGASVVLGSLFAEVGLVAGLIMREAPTSWPLYMFVSELVMFSAVGFYLSRGKNSQASVRISKWNIRLAYLPSLTLLVLVLNNTILIAIFGLVV